MASRAKENPDTNQATVSTNDQDTPWTLTHSLTRPTNPANNDSSNDLLLQQFEEQMKEDEEYEGLLPTLRQRYPEKSNDFFRATFVRMRANKRPREEAKITSDYENNDDSTLTSKRNRIALHMRTTPGKQLREDSEHQLVRPNSEAEKVIVFEPCKSHDAQLEKRLTGVEKNLSATVAKSEAIALLVKHSGTPIKALWEALNDEGTDAAVAMAIVLDRRCGMKRRSTLADGVMASKEGLTRNEEGDGIVPLSIATLAGRVDVMKALLEAGADVHAEDYIHEVALDLAILDDNIAAIELLLDHGADITTVDNWPPLHHAASNGSLEAIEMLLAQGADVERLDFFGDTPLKAFEYENEKNHDTWISPAVTDRIRMLLTPR